MSDQKTQTTKSKWRPIASCPKNIWVLFGEGWGRMVIAMMGESGVISDDVNSYDDDGLTHWQHLPDEPPFPKNKKNANRPILVGEK